MIAIDVQMSILATKPQIVYATGGELHTQGVGVWVWGGGGVRNDGNAERNEQLRVRRERWENRNKID